MSLYICIYIYLYLYLKLDKHLCRYDVMEHVTFVTPSTDVPWGAGGVHPGRSTWAGPPGPVHLGPSTRAGPPGQVHVVRSVGAR